MSHGVGRVRSYFIEAIGDLSYSYGETVKRSVIKEIKPYSMQTILKFFQKIEEERQLIIRIMRDIER